MSAPFLEAVRLHRRFRDGDAERFAVSDVSLEIARGECVALAGPSGSGKSTLLGMLGAVLTPSEGDVKIAGESVVAMRDHHRTAHRRAHIGLVLQGLALIPRMSVLENVLLPQVPSGGASREDRARALALLERLGVAREAKKPAGLLSGGERQRVAIARALITRPTALLLDEPSAHLDAENTARMLEALFELSREGHTVVIASHDPRVLERPELTRVLRLEGGRLGVCERIDDRALGSAGGSVARRDEEGYP